MRSTGDAALACGSVFSLIIPMLSNLKMALWRVWSLLHIFRLRLKGMRFGKGCFVDGMPYVRMAKGSRIILGNDVTLASRAHHNPILKHRAALHTLDPSAVIDLHDHSGISGCSLVCSMRISIGEYTIIGPDTLVYDSEGHHYSPETGWRIRTIRTGNPITIGKKCYIGTRCLILSGANIGDNCVIAAGTVVNRDIPAGHYASGNPAVIKPLPRFLGGPGRKKTAPDA